MESIRYERIAAALFVNYESLYDINMETNEYICFHSSEAYKKFHVTEQGSDFFAALSETVPMIIYSKDVEYFSAMLDKRKLLAETEKSDYYSFIYRVSRDGEPVYHKIRAKKEIIDGVRHVYLGIRDVDRTMKQEQKHVEEILCLRQELEMCRVRNFTSQMQPHFLYNALGAIQELILTDPETASDLVGDFAIYLRGCIRSMEKEDTIPFRQELENIRAYVNIEQIRFGQKLKVVYDVETDGFPVLPLSVQPIVENAIRHGIYKKGREGGTVVLKTRENDNTWEITVTDDGVGFDYEKYLCASKNASESAGLRNLTFRLWKLLRSSVSITSEPGKGTEVIISIPKEKGKTR